MPPAVMEQAALLPGRRAWPRQLVGGASEGGGRAWQLGSRWAKGPALGNGRQRRGRVHAASR